MSQRVAKRLEGTALLLALAGSVGSVALSVGLGLKACPLCFYQRTFMFGVLGLLGVARLLGSRVGPGRAALMALPLVVGGLGVAVFHVSLELNGTLECPPGILGFGTAPKQSLAAFVLVAAAIVPASFRDAGKLKVPLAGAALMGGMFILASLWSAPALPDPKNRAADYVLQGCEPTPIRQP